MHIFNSLLAIAGATSGAVASPYGPSKNAPVVDLGYSIHQASVNNTGKFYTFSNLRYGAPPVGNLRFAAPSPPKTLSREIMTSQAKVRCYQAWTPAEILYFTGKEFSGNVSDLTKPEAADSEDCLFLDVQVPFSIFDKKAKKVAVLVWIHGGGYSSGSKDFNGNGLITQSQSNHGEGIVFVSLNYRLGLFGFLSGPTFQVNGTANAGLLDQRLALEWVQKYIHNFGGDPKRVTVMGESAGGGSVMHQITAYGGLKGKVPFQQAIPQSSGYVPLISAHQLEAYFNTALSTAGSLAGVPVKSLAKLRSLPADILWKTNSLILGTAAAAYNPVVDGSFVPALASHLYLHGQYDKSLKTLVGHNADEAQATTPPIANSSELFNAIFGTILPQAGKDVLDTIINDLYPPIFDGSEGYTDQYGRLKKANAEGYFDCNARWVSKAFAPSSYAYYVTIPPRYHGVDIWYTFFDGDTTTIHNGFPINGTIARKFQSYLTNFVMKSDPNGKGLPKFPKYGDKAETLVIGLEDFGDVMKDNGATERCEFWQKALWY